MEKDERIIIRIKGDEKNRIKAMSDSTGISISDMLRRLIMRKLKRYEAASK